MFSLCNLQHVKKKNGAGGGGGGGRFFFRTNSKKPIDIHFFLSSFRVICYFQHFFGEILKSAPSLTG